MTITLRNNSPRSLTIKYVGGKGEITLFPGVNLFIPEEEWTHAKIHPVVAKWLEGNMITPLKSIPKEEGELEGFTVSTRREDDQPIPHLPARVGEHSLKPQEYQYKVSAEEMAGLTVKEAEKLIRESASTKELTTLKEIDSRKGIQDAIAKRLEEIG